MGLFRPVRYGVVGTGRIIWKNITVVLIYPKSHDNITKAIEARDAEVAWIKRLSKTKQSNVATKNPNLSDVDRALLQEGLDKANFYINKIEELFDPYGGIN